MTSENSVNPKENDLHSPVLLKGGTIVDGTGAKGLPQTSRFLIGDQ